MASRVQKNGFVAENAIISRNAGMAPGSGYVVGFPVERQNAEFGGILIIARRSAN